MKIKLKKISIQNFYSYGDKQTLDFDIFNDSVVLVDGIDEDTEGSKIGSGKSSFFAAITFALFGETVSNIKVNEIVNYIKGKNALVILEFEAGNEQIRIERGRRPNILSLFKFEDNHWVDYSKSDMKDTDNIISNIIKMTFETFLQTTLFSVASEHNKPFLNMTPSNQKKVLENIFNFDIFNNVILEMKMDIKEKQQKHDNLLTQLNERKFANDRIETQINRLKKESTDFNYNKQVEIDLLKIKIQKYKKIDIDKEKEKLNFVIELKDHKNNLTDKISSLKNEKTILTKDLHKHQELKSQTHQQIKNLKNDLKKIDEQLCPTCEQTWNDETYHIQVIKDLKNKKIEVENTTLKIVEFDDMIKLVNNKIKKQRNLIDEIREIIDKIQIKLTNKEVENIDIILANLEDELKKAKNMKNHFLQEIDENEKMLQEMDYSEIDMYVDWINQIKDFIKLSEDTTMRGRFLRKFIKQSNEILREYKRMIPDYNIHLQFNPDFTIRIMKLGKSVSPGTLSNGEKRIGNIMIMMTLMKVFKLKNNIDINIIFMDEVLDSGINGTLLENIFQFIKKMVKKENQKVFLISHRDEIKEKIQEKIVIRKRRGISRIDIEGV